MVYISYSQARYCAECDVIYPSKHSACPVCCNKNGISMNCIRNSMQKQLGKLEERRGEVRSENFNQLKLF